MIWNEKDKMGNKMYTSTNFCIRADANETIGTGHIMRCLTIADVLRRQGKELIFIVADNRSRSIIENKGFKAICLNSQWDDLGQETEKLTNLLQVNNAEKLLVDSYYVTFDYLNWLRENVFTAYIDDMCSVAYPVDLVINYNIYANKEKYRQLYQNSELKPKFALGCGYAPLRKEFSDIHKEINPYITRILVTSGGTDNFNVTGHLVERFLQEKFFGNIEFYFVLGRFNKNIDILKSKYGKYKNIHLLINIPDMAKYMKLCDIAITAGGTTTYELFASGIPSIMYTLADNQLNIARTVSAMGVIPWAGDVRENMILCINNILKWIDIYSSDYRKRKDISSKMQSYIDGKGAERIAHQLLGSNL